MLPVFYKAVLINEFFKNKCDCESILKLFALIFLPAHSYMTTTFVIEAMAAANAQLRWKRREQEEVCV